MELALVVLAAAAVIALLFFPLRRFYRSAPRSLAKSLSQPLSRARGQTSLGPGARGELEFDPEGCLACDLCVHACPSGAIRLVDLEESQHFVLDRSACILCGFCEVACQTNALHHSRRPASRLDTLTCGLPVRESMHCRQCGNEIVVTDLLEGYLSCHLTDERIRTVKLCSDCLRIVMGKED